LYRSYYDLENTLIFLDNTKYSLNVKIDHNNGYAGFESRLGPKVFEGAPQKWDAYEFTFHSGSEHTFSGKRYDLEL